MREYTNHQTMVANLPYVAMVMLGCATIAFGFDFSRWAVGGAFGYLAYGLAGPLWIAVFMCPYCGYYATRGCPCGYGVISARLVPKADQECFRRQFRRHIPAIVPLWLIPAAAGAVALGQSFSWLVVGLVCAFALNSYVVLPVVSKRHSCAECPQKEGCPWMGSRAASG